MNMQKETKDTESAATSYLSMHLPALQSYLLTQCHAGVSAVDDERQIRFQNKTLHSYVEVNIVCLGLLSRI